MSRVKLTDHYVRNLKPPGSGRLEVSDSVRLGLRLRVSPTGRRTWMYEKRVKGGRKRKHTLGTYPALSISEARKRAAELEIEAVQGIDRVAEERSRLAKEESLRQSRVMLREVLSAYDRLQVVHLRTAGERRRMLKTALGPFLDQPVENLTRRDLQKIIDDKADDGALTYANRFKSALAHFARFAWTRGYIDQNVGEGLVGAIREKPRDRVLTVPEIRQILNATYQEIGVFGPLVRLLILTAQRRSNIAELRWSEVNLQRERIELPGARTKNKNAHMTHLSSPALAELKLLRETAGEDAVYVFTTTCRTPVSGFSKLKGRLDARLGPDMAPWRFHDFRTAFATAMAEAGESEALVDRVINHVASASAPSAVARVYNKSSQLPERARILDRWAAIVTDEIAHEDSIEGER